MYIYIYIDIYVPEHAPETPDCRSRLAVLHQILCPARQGGASMCEGGLKVLIGMVGSLFELSLSYHNMDTYVDAE